MLQEHGYNVLTVMDYKSAEPRGDLMIDYAGLTKDDEGKVFWHVAKPDVVKSYLQHILRVRTQGGGGRLDQLRKGGGQMVKKPNGSELESMVYQDFRTVGGKEDDEEKAEPNVLVKQLYVYCDAMKADNQPTKWGKSQTYVKTRPTGMRNGIGEWVSIRSPFPFPRPAPLCKNGEGAHLPVHRHIHQVRSIGACGRSFLASSSRAASSSPCCLDALLSACLASTVQSSNSSAFLAPSLSSARQRCL